MKSRRFEGLILFGMMVIAITMVATTLHHNTSAASGLNLRKEYHDLLVKANWLKYVESSIDQIQYVDDFHAIDDPQSKSNIIGLAKVVDGKRIAVIMTKGQTIDEVTMTVVHEANHLAAFKETGYYSSQQDAEQAEKDFLEALNIARANDPENQQSFFGTSKLFDFKSFAPAALAIYNGGDMANDMLVEITTDGKIKYGPHYTPDAAAKVLWESVATHAPCKSVDMH